MNAYQIFMAGLGLLAVGCSSSTSMGTVQITSLMASSTELVEGQSVTFTAVVTHPGGLQNVTVSRLLSPDGQNYGRFTGSESGTYTLTTSWQDIGGVVPIAFATEEQRTFKAQFTDTSDHTEERTLTLRLNCGGRQACEGRCLDPGGACSAGACIMGVCQANCLGGNGTVVTPGSPNPTDSCQHCTIRAPGWEWTGSAVGTSCGTAKQCIAAVSGTTCSGWVPQRGLAYQVNDPSLVNINAVAAFSASDVITVSSRVTATAASIARSRDGGQTWTSAVPTGTSNFYGVWGSSFNDLYVVGSRGSVANGAILHSTDGGVNWTSQTSIPYDLAAVWGSAANDVYIVGDGGAVLHSTDSGTTWTQVHAGSIPLLAVWGSGANDVYAIGSQGLVIRSVDNGKTWTQQTTNKTVALNAIWGSDAGNVFIVGNGGLILRTADNGTTWTQQSSGVTSNLNSVWGSGASDIYVSGSSGEILHTTNNGQTWTALTSGTTKSLLGLGGSGAANVFVVGQQGLVMRKL